MAALPPPPPRLQGRLTAELVLSSPQGFNAVKDYELDLRGACRGHARAPEGCGRVCALPAGVAAALGRAEGLPRANPKGDRDPPARAGHKLGTIENLAVSQVSVVRARWRRLAA